MQTNHDSPSPRRDDAAQACSSAYQSMWREGERRGKTATPGRGSRAFAVRALGRVPVLFISPKIHKALEQYLR